MFTNHFILYYYFIKRVIYYNIYERDTSRMYKINIKCDKDNNYSNVKFKINKCRVIKLFCYGRILDVTIF